MFVLMRNHLDAWVVATAIVVVALLVHGRLAFETLPLALAVGCSYWIAFALNDYFDAPYDGQDPAKGRDNYFVQRPSGNHWFWVTVAGLAGLVSLALIPYGWRGMAVILFGATVAWAYSAPPLRLKARPGADVLAHAIFVETYPYVATLVILQAVWTSLDLFILTILFLASLSAQLEQQLRDFELDMVTGRTFAIVAGRTLTHRMLIGATLSILTAAAIYYLSADVPLFLIPFGLIPLPALLHRLTRSPAQPRSPRLVTVTALAGLAYTIWLVAREIFRAA